MTLKIGTLFTGAGGADIGAMQAAPNAFDVQRRMREARRKLKMLGWQSERKLHSVTPRIWAYRVTKLEVQL